MVGLPQPCRFQIAVPTISCKRARNRLSHPDLSLSPPLADRLMCHDTAHMISERRQHYPSWHPNRCMRLSRPAFFSAPMLLPCNRLA